LKPECLAGVCRTQPAIKPTAIGDNLLADLGRFAMPTESGRLLNLSST
jgi:hypothetical protein